RKRTSSASSGICLLFHSVALSYHFRACYLLPKCLCAISRSSEPKAPGHSSTCTKNGRPSTRVTSWVVSRGLSQDASLPFCSTTTRKIPHASRTFFPLMAWPPLCGFPIQGATQTRDRLNGEWRHADLRNALAVAARPAYHPVADL